MTVDWSYNILVCDSRLKPVGTTYSYFIILIFQLICICSVYGTCMLVKPKTIKKTALKKNVLFSCYISFMSGQEN